jgi:hypothetical protein
MRPLRRGHPPRHAVRPRPSRRRPDSLPRPRARGLQSRREAMTRGKREAGGWDGKATACGHCRPRGPQAFLSSLLLLDRTWQRRKRGGGRLPGDGMGSKKRAFRRPKRSPARICHEEIAAHFTFLRVTGILKEAGGGGPLGAAGGQPVGDEPPASQGTALRAPRRRSSTRYCSSVGAISASFPTYGHLIGHQDEPKNLC